MSGMRAGLVVCALVASSGVARADGDRALSLGLGYATFSLPGVQKQGSNMVPPDITPYGGGQLTLAYEHGLSTDLSLRIEGAGGAFYGGAQKGQSDFSMATLADAGVVFRFDVTKYVPYAFAGVGGVLATGGPIETDATFVLALGGGVDWLKSRDRSYGIEVRLASFAGDITVFTIGVRASRRWGYF
jgi:hypothetical protein